MVARLFEMVNPACNVAIIAMPDARASATTNRPGQIRGCRNLDPAFTGCRNLDAAFTGRRNLDPAFTGRRNLDPAFTGQRNLDPAFTGQRNLDPAFTERVSLVAIAVREKPSAPGA
jgi:hypothetical protein